MCLRPDGMDWPSSEPVRSSDGNFLFVARADLCNATGQLFGGWCLGMMVHAGQTASGLALRDLSANFLAPVARGSALRVTPRLLSAGRTLQQWRIDSWAPGEVLAVTANAVLGPPPEERAASKIHLVAPPPLECRVVPYAGRDGTGSSAAIETRLPAIENTVGADGSRTLLWVRVIPEVDDSVLVAVASDHLPSVVKDAFPGEPFVPTVAATLRLFARPTSRWLLLDIRLTSSDTTSSGEPLTSSPRTDANWPRPPSTAAYCRGVREIGRGTRLKVYEALARTLRDHEVDVLFGLTGDANLFMVYAYVHDQHGRFVATAHESGAVQAAAGYASVTGRVGVATVTHGPALTNTVTSLVDAVRGRSAVVLIAGDTNGAERETLQDIDQREVVAVTGAGFEQVRSAPTAAHDLAVALRQLGWSSVPSC